MQWGTSVFKFAHQTLFWPRSFFFLFFFLVSASEQIQGAVPRLSHGIFLPKICITLNMRFINYEEALNENKAGKNRRIHTAFSSRNQRHALFLSLSHMCNRVFSEPCACALRTRYCAGAFSCARESVVAGLESEMLLCSLRVAETPSLWKKRSPSSQRVRALILFP
jgi:hypothetical protein